MNRNRASRPRIGCSGGSLGSRRRSVVSPDNRHCRRGLPGSHRRCSGVSLGTHRRSGGSLGSRCWGGSLGSRRRSGGSLGSRRRSGGSLGSRCRSGVRPGTRRRSGGRPGTRRRSDVSPGNRRSGGSPGSRCSDVSLDTHRRSGGSLGNRRQVVDRPARRDIRSDAPRRHPDDRRRCGEDPKGNCDRRLRSRSDLSRLHPRHDARDRPRRACRIRSLLARRSRHRIANTGSRRDLLEQCDRHAGDTFLPSQRAQALRPSGFHVNRATCGDAEILHHFLSRPD